MCPISASGITRNIPSSSPRPARKIGANTSGRARLAPRIAASGVLISTARVGLFFDTSVKAGWQSAQAFDEIARSRLVYRAAATSWPREENDPGTRRSPAARAFCIGHIYVAQVL